MSTVGDGNNFLSSVAPGECQVYTYEIPADHPTGTYWYGAEHHGGRAIQVQSGCFGGFKIVNDAQAVSPVVAAMKDRFLVLSEFELYGVSTVNEWMMQSVNNEAEKAVTQAAADTMQWLNVDLGDGSGMTGRRCAKGGAIYPFNGMSGNVCAWYLVNGQERPWAQMRPGEWQYWRLAHPAVELNLFLTVRNCQVYVMAVDGIDLESPVDYTGRAFMLQQGGKADIAVMCPSEGSYALEAIYNDVTAGILGNGYGYEGIISMIKVSGPAMSMASPSSMNTNRGVHAFFGGSLTGMPASMFSGGQFTWEYAHHSDMVAQMMGTFPAYADATVANEDMHYPNLKPWMPYLALNGILYEHGFYGPNSVQYKMMRGVPQEWVLTRANVMGEPVHLQGYKFQVTSITPPTSYYDDNYVFGAWRDSIYIPVGRFITIRLMPNREDMDGYHNFGSTTSGHADFGMVTLIEQLTDAGVSIYEDECSGVFQREPDAYCDKVTGVCTPPACMRGVSVLPGSVEVPAPVEEEAPAPVEEAPAEEEAHSAAPGPDGKGPTGIDTGAPTPTPARAPEPVPVPEPVMPDLPDVVKEDDDEESEWKLVAIASLALMVIAIMVAGAAICMSFSQTKQAPEEVYKVYDV
jgi:FtsP/CotA-like multicopper oxidase with cupredoxin domain